MPIVRFVAPRLLVAVAAVALSGLAPLSRASAQFDPPSTVFGSVADSAGEVASGLTVEAYIGDKLCGTNGRTEFTGDGAAKVTVYFVDVVSESQIAGCGAVGREVRIKVGDRFAPQTARWNPGPVQLDLAFAGATPAVIPTFTPAPTRTPEPTTTPRPRTTPSPGATGTVGETATAEGTETVETIPPGSPGAGSPIATPRGGVTSATPGQSSDGSGGGDGGFPVWGVVVLILGGIAAIGGGVGYAMSRNSRVVPDSADTFPPED